MKSQLVIGLGNPLMGDEGIAFHLMPRLAADPRLPEDVELFWAGDDLLNCAEQMAGRARATLLDAMLDPSEPGVLRVIEDFADLETHLLSAHQLSAAGAIELLRIAYPDLRGVRFRLMAVTVSSAEIRPELSPALEARLPELLDEILQELG